MDQATHNKMVSFVWGIADDVLRDRFRRGRYPDVILPRCVLRRMDAVLEPTRQVVHDTTQMLDNARVTGQRAALPVLEEGGIEAFIRREELPYTLDAGVNNNVTKIGYEISFMRHFYKLQPLRTLAEISADILAIERESEGLLGGLLAAKATA